MKSIKFLHKFIEFYRFVRTELQYSFKKINMRLWNEVFGLKTPYLNSSKNYFWSYQ